MEMIFHSRANKTHFHKKGFALGLILKVRVLELGSGLLRFEVLYSLDECRGHDVFAILPTGSGRESLIFLTLSTKNERTERKSWRVNFFLFVSFCFVLFFFSIQFNSLFHTIQDIYTSVRR